MKPPNLQTEDRLGLMDCLDKAKAHLRGAVIDEYGEMGGGGYFMTLSLAKVYRIVDEY
jgi:hypothetical protein